MSSSGSTKRKSDVIAEKRQRVEPSALPLQAQVGIETGDAGVAASGIVSSINLLNYNQVIPQQLAITSYSWQEILPTTRLPNSDPNDPLEFNLDAIENSYTDFFGGFLDYSISVWSLNDQGQPTALEAGELVCPINLPGLTYFKRVELWNQDLQILGHYNDFDSLAYTQVVLFANEYAKTYPLKSWGYYPDTPGLFDTVAIAGAAGTVNEGAKSRVGLIETSQKCNFIVPVAFDIGGVSNLIPDKTDLLLRYWRHTPEYFLMTGRGNTKKYVVILSRAVLRIVRYQLAPSDLAHLNRLISLEGVILAATQGLVKRKTFLAGEQNLSFVCFREMLPAMIFVSLVDADAVNGNYKKNPLQCDLAGLSRITAFKNDIPYPLSNGISIPAASNMELLYFFLIKSLHGGTPSFLPPAMNNGYGIMCFDMTAGNTGNSVITSRVEGGTIRVEMDLSTPLTKAMVMKVQGVMQCNLQITGGQNGARALTINNKI